MKHSGSVISSGERDFCFRANVHVSVSESIIIAACVMFRLHAKETCVRSKHVPSARVADVNELCVIVDVADLFTMRLRRRKILHKVKSPGNMYGGTLPFPTVCTYTSFRMVIAIVKRENADSLNWKIIHPRSGGMVRRDDALIDILLCNGIRLYFILFG